MRKSGTGPIPASFSYHHVCCATLATLIYMPHMIRACMTVLNFLLSRWLTYWAVANIPPRDSSSKG